MGSGDGVMQAAGCCLQAGGEAGRVGSWLQLWGCLWGMDGAEVVLRGSSRTELSHLRRRLGAGMGLAGVQVVEERSRTDDIFPYARSFSHCPSHPPLALPSWLCEAMGACWTLPECSSHL